MDITQQIKDAHPWLSYNEAVKVLLYHYQGSIWINNLKRNELERSIGSLTKLVKSKSRYAVKPFVEYVLNAYYNGAEEYEN